MQQAKDSEFAMNDASAPQIDTVPVDTLPAWDLSDLYSSPNSPEVMADLGKAEQMARDFAQAHAGTRRTRLVGLLLIARAVCWPTGSTRCVVSNPLSG